MESRADSENAERILYNMNPKQLLEVSCNAFYQKSTEIPKAEPVSSTPRIKGSHHNNTDEPSVPIELITDDTVNRKPNAIVDPKEVGHNIYILCHQSERSLVVLPYTHCSN